MSEETIQNEQKVENNCKVTLCIILSILALLLSISALTVSIISANGGIASSQEGKKVVISKQYDKGRSLKKAIDADKPMIVFFYTDWCGFCQRFVPTFDKVTKDKRIKQNFAIAYVNCEDQANSAYVQEYGVHGFPTVFVVKQDGSRTQLDNNTFFNDDSKNVIVKNALDIIGE